MTDGHFHLHISSLLVLFRAASERKREVSPIIQPKKSRLGYS